jgi:leader peptidase (prepilin peptidase)/N-methyltransferase
MTVAERWDDGGWVRGRSRCNHCGTVLAARDLVPIASWLWTRGRCRHCGKPIGRELLLAEVAAALILVMPFLFMGSASEASLVGMGGLTLLLLSLIDLRTGRLPHVLTALFAGVGVARGWLVAGGASGSLIAIDLGEAAIIWALLSLFRLAYLRLRGRDGLGGGDIMLLAAAGFWLQPTGLAWSIVIAGSLAIVTLLISRRRLDLGTSLPFGPFIAASVWLLTLFGDHLHQGLDAAQVIACHCRPCDDLINSDIADRCHAPEHGRAHAASAIGQHRAVGGRNDLAQRLDFVR